MNDTQVIQVQNMRELLKVLRAMRRDVQNDTHIKEYSICGILGYVTY